MTKPISLQQLQATLAEALSSLDRDQLVEVLTSVLQAYVVEGAPRVDGPASGRLLADLANVPFAQLVTELQMSCEQPELAALRVEGMGVQVRVGGQWVPVLAPSQAVVAAPAAVAGPVAVAPAIAASAAVTPIAPNLAGVAAVASVASAPASTALPGETKPEGGDAPGADRFSLLELD